VSGDSWTIFKLDRKMDATSIDSRESASNPEKVRSFFRGLFKIMFGISTLGTTFTYSFILGDIQTPVDGLFSDDDVRFFIAMSWFLFMSSLTFACFSSLILNFWGDEAVAEFRQKRRWHFGAFVMSVILVSTLIGAIVFLDLVVMAYELRIGIAGLIGAGCVSISAVVMAMIVLRVHLRIKARDEERPMPSTRPRPSTRPMPITRRSSSYY
jgi:hypothetical protein